MMGLIKKNGGKNMNVESKKKDIEFHSGDWLRKYDDLEQRLELARRILNKYPQYMPPFNRVALPFEIVEILLSDIQELHSITSEG
jgi:type IV secretory pathway TrbF-like protein